MLSLLSWKWKEKDKVDCLFNSRSQLIGISEESFGTLIPNYPTFPFEVSVWNPSSVEIAHRMVLVRTSETIGSMYNRVVATDDWNDIVALPGDVGRVVI